MNFNSVSKYLLPNNNLFFPMFNESVENLVLAAELLRQALHTDDPADRSAIILKIRDKEHIGDVLTHRIFQTLNTSFITPFDREDIYALASSLDDVLDYIDASANAVVNYRLEHIEEEMKTLSVLILSGTQELKNIIGMLPNYRKKDTMLQNVITLNSIENEADAIFNTGMAGLFNKGMDIMELIKAKEILQLLEMATDKAEDVSNVIETIIIKAS